jgi:hypothetical protein
MLLLLALGIGFLAASDPHAAALVARSPLVLGWSAVQADRTSAVAWGDMDGDGNLDLALGNNCRGASSNCVAIKLYRSTQGDLEDTTFWSAAFPEDVRSLAWGDVDQDGDLDLAVGISGAPVKVYENIGSQLNDTSPWVAERAEATSSVAWGDVDNDGDLDLAVGNAGQPLRLYRNMDGVLEQTPGWSSGTTDQVTSLAWGDVDGDGDLDLAVGAWLQSRLYRNVGGILETTAVWSSPELLGDFTSSVAWGDVDGDGDLDLAVGNGDLSGTPNRLYANSGGTLSASPVWSSTEEDNTSSVAWGDVDHDGDLDLAVGNIGLNGEPNRLYENNGGTLRPAAVWSSPEADVTSSIAWGDLDNDGDLDLAAGNGGANTQLSRVYLNQLGVLPPVAAYTLASADDIQRMALGDMDGDGDLDLAVGTYRQPDRVYANVNGVLTPTPVWSSAEPGRTTSIAWGDADNDGDLDLAVGYNFQPVNLYRNTGTTLEPAPAWSSTERAYVTSLAWGDVDGDGDLDLAVGTNDAPNRLYLNSAGQLSASAIWSSASADSATSLAWGDVDGDGDLDLAAGTPARIYRNDGGSLTSTPVWTSTWSDGTTSIAWGDVDGDGDLDLAVGNGGGQPNRLYRNDDGILSADPVWTTIEADNTTSIAWGDVDGDGDLDLAVGNSFDQPNRIYLNEQGALARSAAWVAAERGSTRDLAFGDMDRDGSLDLIAGTGAGEPARIYLNRRNRPDGPAPIPAVYVTRPGSTAQADHDAVAEILDGPTIAVPYVLRHPQRLPVRQIMVEYSLNGGGNWKPAKPTAETQTENLTTSPDGTVHTFVWDVYGSGIMGRHDHVTLRVTALPDLRAPTGHAPGPFLSGAFAATTNPFRIRGSQVRVLHADQPVAGALVYRVPAGANSALEPYTSLDGQPFHTDQQGYLQGSGTVTVGDRLVATFPVSSTSIYTLLYTSAAPTNAGLESSLVRTAGVQTLTVSPDNPLILFHLDISLEWDARGDERFLAQLRFNLQRASELLFDWTDGQVALGQVTIFHDAANWDDAHVRIYATNRLRPNANQGGVVTQALTDPLVTATTYTPGQVHMGVIWNRYGEAYGDLGEDWPRAFAHELGHFLLFLDDNYLGLDEANRLISVDTCPGAMSNPYRDDYSEFHPAAGWLPGCQRTLSQQNTERSDWETIQALYSFPDVPFQLRAPAAFAANTGPHTLPLATLHVREAPIHTRSTTLAAPIFTLTQAGNRVLPGSAARSILFRPDDGRLIDLGSPTLDQVTARGARSGDRLCVYDLPAERLGCVEDLTDLTSQIPLVHRPGWSPEVLVTPVTSSTLTIDVRKVPAGLDVRGRVFPLGDEATAAMVFAPVAGGYRADITLAEPVLGGYAQIWVENDPVPRREVVVDYTLGGNPGSKFGRNAPRGRNPGSKFGRNAPAVSSDGQAVIYGDNLTFLEGQFFTLQSASQIPDPPVGRTPVGLGYWLSATANAPALDQASLLISYLSRDVPAAEEGGIEMYHWDGQSWTALDSTLYAERNEAAALVRGPGLYTLMSSYRVPLREPGWNLIAYPVPGSRTVEQALVSIDDLYTTVYGYEPTDTDPWKVFDIDAPDWVNDLAELEFGTGYWIHVNDNATLYIQGEAYPETSTISASGSAHLAGASVPTPPATYYGVLRPGPGFVPEAGTPVAARIGDVVCGRSQTRLRDGEVVYSVAVSAMGDGAQAGCGGQGRLVTLQVGTLTLSTLWDNSRVWRVEPNWVFLPLIGS